MIEEKLAQCKVSKHKHSNWYLVELLRGFRDNFKTKKHLSPFADNSTAVGDAKRGQNKNLKWMLRWFEVLSALKINFQKCELMR